MTYGSLNNLMYANSRTDETPTVGMGATVVYWTDRVPATVVEVRTFKGGARAGQVREVVVQLDAATRVDSNGMSDAQSWEFAADPNGVRYTATVRKDGTFRVAGSSLVVVLGTRSKYYDYSF